jgi:hypothetical protein
VPSSVESQANAEDQTNVSEPDLRWQTDDEIERIEESIRAMNQEFSDKD